MRDATSGGAVGLVDVHSLDGTAERGCGGTAIVFLCTADGVVEDEDA